MWKCFAVATGSVAALVGFAGAANASATVDLIWIDLSATDATGNPICLEPANRNCPPDPRSPDNGVTINPLTASDYITLAVIITAGSGGVVGGGVSVDYSSALQFIGGIDFRNFTTTNPDWLLGHFGVTSNMPPFIDNINAVSVPYTNSGTGLPANESAYLGTVSFELDQLVNGTYEITVGAFGPGGMDGIGNLAHQNITSSTTFNSAFVTITDPNDVDGDGVNNASDNCLNRKNPDQDDTDCDTYGNLCDADYDNSGIVGFPDFGQFVGAFGSNDEEKCHVEPIARPPCVVGFPDFGAFVGMFGSAPGPSGTTACP
jgi:hypothetical protein